MELDIKKTKRRVAEWLESFLMKRSTFTGHLRVNIHNGKVKSVETWTKETEQFRD